MSNNQKKYLTIAAVALVVIVADKMFGVSDKTVSRLGGRHTGFGVGLRGWTMLTY